MSQVPHLTGQTHGALGVAAVAVPDCEAAAGERDCCQGRQNISQSTSRSDSRTSLQFECTRIGSTADAPLTSAPADSGYVAEQSASESLKSEQMRDRIAKWMDPRRAMRSAGSKLRSVSLGPRFATGHAAGTDAGAPAAANVPSGVNDTTADCDVLAGEADGTHLRNELAHLGQELELERKRRHTLERSLQSERDRYALLQKQNDQLHAAVEERTLGLRQIGQAEAEEHASQVSVLLEIKRQLHERVTLLEEERNRLMVEREAQSSDRACIACMDQLATVVFMGCQHLVCCATCARRCRECPVCRCPVRGNSDRLVVYMLYAWKALRVGLTF